MAFGNFEVHAGDFKKGKDHQFVRGKFYMKTEGQFLRETIDVSRIEELEIVSEENAKKLAGTIGWGFTGATLLGPVGLLAGLIAGGKGKYVTFVCKFADGRKFMASAPAKVYTEISAYMFE